MGARVARGYDAKAFANQLEQLTWPLELCAQPRGGPSAAYLCTSGGPQIERRLRDLSYRFDIVYLLGPAPNRTLPPNASKLEWEGHWAAAWFRSCATTKLSAVVGVSDDWDLPCKRTVALAHAAELGHGLALLVDDDVWPASIADQQLFRSIENGILGKPPLSSADLSVVEEWCGADPGPHRFPNGNYLYFDPTAELGFFPRVYNDDWLFLVASSAARPAIAPTESLYQAARPVDLLRRAREQEFGETLAKGYLHGGRGAANVSHWADVCCSRKQYLSDLLEAEQRAPQAMILRAALDVHLELNVGEFVRWSTAFQRDLEGWRQIQKAIGNEA